MNKISPKAAFPSPITWEKTYRANEKLKKMAKNNSKASMTKTYSQAELKKVTKKDSKSLKINTSLEAEPQESTESGLMWRVGVTNPTPLLRINESRPKTARVVKHVRIRTGSDSLM